MKLKELLNGMKDVIIDSLTSGNSTEDILEALNGSWDIHATKIETIVEALSIERSNTMVEEAKSNFAQEMKEEFNATNKMLSDRASTYFAEAYDNFVKEYKPSIVSNAKVKIVEEYHEKLKKALNENGLDLDTESKANVEHLSEKIDSLQNKLDEAVTDKIDLKQKLKDKDFELTFASVKQEQNLSETQCVRLKAMVDLTRINESGEDLKTKLETIVHSSVLTESKKEDEQKDTLNEDVENAPTLDEKPTANIDNSLQDLFNE